MPIKKNDFVEVEYTGIVTEENAVFDTCNEKLAKEAGIYSEKSEYGPIIICVGEHHLIPGLDEFLEGKGIGEYKVTLSPEKAFGKKDAKLIEFIPMKKFTEQEIQPVPGLQINIDGIVGTILRVGGGRTLVDFNHPLAGKEVTYEIKVRRIIEDKKEQVKAIMKIMLRIKDADIKIENDAAKITLKAKMPPQVAEKLKEKIIGLTKLKNIEFLEEKKQSPKEDKNMKKSENKKESTPAQ